jgi:hypothetical protein
LAACAAYYLAGGGGTGGYHGGAAKQMNWKRGLIRFWIVLSVAWIGGAFWMYDPVAKYLDPIGTYQVKPEIGEARIAGYTDAEIAVYLRRKAMISFSELAFLPPLILLVLGYGGLWSVRGLNDRPSN